MTVLENDISIYSKKEIEKLSAAANELIKSPIEKLVDICRNVDDKTLDIALKTLNFMESKDEKRKEVIKAQIVLNEKASSNNAFSSKYNRW